MSRLPSDNPSGKLAEEYSAKAAQYARRWVPVIRPMALPLLELLPLWGARRILDIGTGTGSLLPDFAAAAEGGSVVGIDRAEGMLRLVPFASRRAVAVMDAGQLAIRSGVMDVAALVFVIFHLPDPITALKEARRVLRTGGVLGIASWGGDPGAPGLAFWREELDRAGAEPDPRPASVMQQDHTNAPDKLHALLAQAGFASVRTESRTMSHRWTVKELIATQIGCGMAARRLPSLSPTAAAGCLARVEARLHSLSADDLVYRPEVLFSVARKAE